MVKQIIVFPNYVLVHMISHKMTDLKAKAGNIVPSRKIKTMFDMRQFLNIPENVFLTVTLAEVCSLFLSPTHFLHQRVQCFTSFKYFKLFFIDND